MKTLEEILADAYFDRVDQGELIPIPIEDEGDTKTLNEAQTSMSTKHPPPKGTPGLDGEGDK
jgi:hypothetical protein